MKLEIVDFIKQNPDWERILAESPYFVRTKRDGNFVLLKYDQTHSDVTMPMVRECRGIIFDADEDFLPICIPFFKFGNYGENYVPSIDWKTARVQEKLDGSLIKLWYYKDEWHISSNGEIDARNASISSALLMSKPVTNLYVLFMKAWDETGIDMNTLDINLTYMFELLSLHNRIVVKHEKTSLVHIGTRNNITYEECCIDIGISKPREYPFTTLKECIEAASQLGCDEEGYVVVDKNYNRIKVKSPLYVALAHTSQGITTSGNVIEIIKKNEQFEFLSYFPEYAEVFEKLKSRIDLFVQRQITDLSRIKSLTFDSRKALAEEVTKAECPACLFSLIDSKSIDPREWLFSRSTTNILKYIGYE